MVRMASHVNQSFAPHSQTFRASVGRSNIVEVICILFMRQAYARDKKKRGW